MELVSLAKEDNDDGGIDSIAFDLSTYEGHRTLESQLDEMFLFFEDIVKTKLAPTAPKNQGTPLNGVEEDAKAFLLKLSVSKSPKERGPNSPVGHAKYQQKPVQYVSPKSTPRRIQQPR